MLNAKLLALVVIATAGMASTSAEARRPSAGVAVSVAPVAVQVGPATVVVGGPGYYAPPPRTVVYRNAPVRSTRVVYAPVNSCNQHGHYNARHQHVVQHVVHHPAPSGHGHGHYKQPKHSKHSKHHGKVARYDNHRDDHRSNNNRGGSRNGNKNVTHRR